MSWTTWLLMSAFFLALYDLAKKASVRENAVLPVLLCSTTCGCLAFTAGVFFCGRLSQALALTDGRLLVLAATKSIIVAVSWIFTFCALQTLPITIATPIRASAPALVFVAAFFLYGEVPSWAQGLGMLAVFGGYWAFSWAGRHEGIDFLHNRAVWCAVVGACFSAISSLWDKYVFQVAAAPVVTVQFYFQVGLVLVYAAILGGQRILHLPRTPFTWRWTIPFVGILLAMADWLFFNGLAVPGAPVSVGTLLRRFSVVLTFILGAHFFNETNLKRKAVALTVILIGVALLCL